MTVNPYFGIDGIKPFLDIAREESKGVFALVQTSNDSASPSSIPVSSETIRHERAVSF